MFPSPAASLLILFACETSNFSDIPEVQYETTDTADDVENGEDKGGGGVGDDLDDSGGEDPDSDDSATPDDDDTGDGGGDGWGAPLLQFGDGERPVNLLMITVDTLRRDFTDTFSPTPRGLTPNLDALMAESVVLTRHRSCANWTFQSMLCGLSGRYSVHTGYVPIAGDDRYVDLRSIPADTVLLSRKLKEAGFTTAMLSTNSFLSETYGFAEDYDLFETFQGLPAEEVTDEGLRLVNLLERGDAPWYMHVHYIDPHAPYQAPEEYYDGPLIGPGGLDLSEGADVNAADAAYDMLSETERQELREYAQAAYGAEVAYTDAQIGRLLAQLQLIGALEDTLVVFFTDHGEQLFDRGHLEHHDRLHSEESSALAFFWARGIEPFKLDTATSHVDLAPTTLEGLGLLDDWRTDGLALRVDAGERPTFSQVLQGPESRQAIDYRGKRLTFGWDGSLGFYHLGSDPGERLNRYDPQDPEVRTLWSMLVPMIEDLDEYYDGYSPELPDLEPLATF